MGIQGLYAGGVDVGVGLCRWTFAIFIVVLLFYALTMPMICQCLRLLYNIKIAPFNYHMSISSTFPTGPTFVTIIITNPISLLFNCLTWAHRMFSL